LLVQSNTTQSKRSQVPSAATGNSQTLGASELARESTFRHSQGSSTADPKQNQASARDRDPRAAKQEQPQSPAVASPAKAPAPAVGVTTPRRREKKKDEDIDIMKLLQQICTNADPTRLYRNLIRIRQEWVEIMSVTFSWIQILPLVLWEASIQLIKRAQIYP
jgi:p21-activated kinase 1